jgi:PKD repeat protein
VTLGNDNAVAAGTPVTVMLNGTTVANGTAVVGPNATGSATLNADIESGPYEATVTAPGSTITRTVRITDVPDLTGDGRPARDPDGDGLFEDVNGDGMTNVFDALAYYNNRNSDGIRTNPEYFDFDGDGVSGTVFDALALYNERS